MSIEQKIAELLAESRAGEEFVEESEDYEALDELSKATLGSYVKKANSEIAAKSKGAEIGTVMKRKMGVNQATNKLAREEYELDTYEDVIEEGNAEANNLTGAPSSPNPDNARNNVTDENPVAKGTTKKSNKVTDNAEAGDQSVIRVGNTVKEDVDALVNGEDLSEEFKAKAATIFEAAIVARVKQEVATLEEEFEARLEEAAAENQEGLVEKVDGYLNYVVETWIAQNEIALERGMKSEILENFVSGLKGLFEENYIDIPEEKFDVLSAMETQIEELQSKLDEQLAANVEMNKFISEQSREVLVKEACVGLTDTEVEKFTNLVEELSYEDQETFANKVQTIRENYFTNKATTKVVGSIVTDEPVSLTEEKFTSPQMKSYMNALDNLK